MRRQNHEDVSVAPGGWEQVRLFSARLKTLSDRSGDRSAGGRRFHVAGSLTAKLRCPVGNLCDVYIENFITNHPVKEFWNSVHVCRTYYQTSNSLLFGTRCIGLYQTSSSRVMFTVGRLVRIKEVVWCKMLRETRFNDAFYYFWYKRGVGNWLVIRVHPCPR